MIDFVYTLPVRAVNRTGVNSYGFEYQFDWSRFDIIAINGQYNYLNMEDKEGIPVLYRSKHRGQLSLSIKTELIDFILSNRYWSKQYFDDFLSHDYSIVGNKVIFPINVLPGQIIPEFILSKKLNSFKVSVKISNPLNTSYELIQDYPMPGRSVHGTLTRTL